MARCSLWALACWRKDRVRLLLSWRPTGFSLHNQVTLPPADSRAIEALARYCLRTPVSLTRLRLTAGSSEVEYLAAGGHDNAPPAPPGTPNPATFNQPT